MWRYQEATLSQLTYGGGIAPWVSSSQSKGMSEECETPRLLVRMLGRDGLENHGWPLMSSAPLRKFPSLQASIQSRPELFLLLYLSPYLLTCLLTCLLTDDSPLVRVEAQKLAYEVRRVLAEEFREAIVEREHLT